MRTQLVGTLELDQARLLADLERSTKFHYSEPYTEFLCGRPWKSLMLFTPGGTADDDVISHYDSAKDSSFTTHGEQLPYIRKVIEKFFAVEHMTFARLAVMRENVMLPHCDYVELSDPFAQRRAVHRMHLVLATSKDCLFTEADVVYQMNVGEVWFLDATRPHGAGVLSDFRRVHLLLDFADVAQPGKLLNFAVTPSADIPASSIRSRPAISYPERATLLSLASIADMDNLREIFGIVIKTHYRNDGGADFVWDTMGEIARLSNDDAIIAEVARLHKHCILERDE
jgi:hypothetical protein